MTAYCSSPRRTSTGFLMGIGLRQSRRKADAAMADLTKFDFAKRRPGRINLNAIQRPDVLAALIDDRAVLEQNWWWNPSINEVDYTFPDFGPSLNYTTLQGIKPSFHRPELVLRSRLGRRSAPNQIQQFGDFDVDLNGDRIADAIWMDLDSDL